MCTPQLDQTAFKFLNKCLHVVKYEIYKLTSGIGIILAIEISGGEGWQRLRIPYVWYKSALIRTLIN